MNPKSPWTLCLLLLVAALAPAAHGATVTPCKPVLYAFPNAEDTVSTGIPCLPGSRIQCYNTVTLERKEHAERMGNRR